MKEFVLHRNLHVDPLTRLKNFIQFIEEDFSVLFDERGLILIFDIIGLREINSREGREVGDELIKAAASILCTQFGKEVIYRTEGDAFTIVLSNENVEDAKERIDNVLAGYDNVMEKIGYSDCELHYVSYDYDEPIPSIEDFYMFVFKKKMMKALALDVFVEINWSVISLVVLSIDLGNPLSIMRKSTIMP